MYTKLIANPRRAVDFPLKPMFDNLFENQPLNYRCLSMVKPPANIKKDENGFAIDMILPGFKKDQLQINLENRKLTISVKSASHKDVNYKLKEFDFSKAKREFRLPRNIDSNAISASFSNGILSLILPIAEEAKPRKIEIR